MKNILLKTMTAIVLSIAGVGVAAALESPLGSPTESVGRYTQKYDEAVKAALPKIDLPGLTKVMRDVQAAASAEKPLTIASVSDLERVFSLPSRAKGESTEVFDFGDVAYQFDATVARIFLMRRYDGLQPVSRDAFTRQLSAIKSSHAELATKLGISPAQVLFADFRETLSQTDGHPVTQKGAKGEIQSEGATSTLLRAVAGVLVEGSYARISSIDAKRLDMVDVRWPAVKIADSALKYDFRAPQESTATIAKRVGQNAAGLAVNVRMAVVLRPIQDGRMLAFVPSLKVGVTPQSVKSEDGYRTDAGEVFYVDLIRGSAPFVDGSEGDAAQ